MPRVEVAYVGRRTAWRRELEVEPGTTVRETLLRSGVLERHPQLDLAVMRVGVFGRPRGLDEPVEPGDRIEIYRPLPDDPKEIRRRRAARRA